MNSQTRQIRHATSSLVLLLLLVGACGDSSSRQAAEEGTAPPAEDMQANSEAGACRFLSEAEAEAVLGYPVKLVSTSAYGSIEECEFEPVGGEQYGAGDLFIRVNEPMDPEASFAETRASAGTVEDIADVGDQAFLYGTELWVLAGSHEVVVRVSWYSEQAAKVREANINIAKTVISRL